MLNKQTDIDRPVWVKALLNRSLSPTAYRVFAYLFWRQGSNGSCWPSQDLIAADLGLSERTVRTITKQIEEQGYLRVIRPDGQGRGRALEYAILTQQKGGDDFPPLSQKGRNELPPLDAKRREKPVKKGGSQFPPNTKSKHKEREKTDSSGKTCVGKSLLPDISPEDFPNSKSTKRKVFKPPTAEQVRQYAESIDYLSLNAEGFVDWYGSKGWMVGKNKMKDWQAAVRTWKQRDEANGKKTGRPKKGEPGWVPSDAEADQIFREAGIIA